MSIVPRNSNYGPGIAPLNPSCIPGIDGVQCFGGTKGGVSLGIPTGLGARRRRGVGQVPMVQEVNLNTGSTSLFSVGDTWNLQIRGAAPNAPIAWTGTQNGVTQANMAPAGSTDANGNQTIGGVAGPAQVGNWVETWYVGGVPVGNINITIVPAGTTVSQAPAPVVSTPPTIAPVVTSVPTLSPANTVSPDEIFANTLTPSQYALLSSAFQAINNTGGGTSVQSASVLAPVSAMAATLSPTQLGLLQSVPANSSSYPVAQALLLAATSSANSPQNTPATTSTSVDLGSIFSQSTIISGIPDIAVYGGGVAALLILLMVLKK